MADVYNDAANSLRRLKFLSIDASFEEVQRLAREIKDHYDKCIEVENVGQFLLAVSMVDKTALMVLEKEDREKDIQPVKTKADGNCLFNPASIAICQTEMLADQLRLRTALELLLNPNFYSSPPVVMKMQDNLPTMSGSMWSKEGLYDAVIFSNRASSVFATQGFLLAFRAEIYSTLCNSSYSGILQIMGLSSAIGCEIKLVYRDKRHSLYPLLSASYAPRLCGSQVPAVTIMWTNTAGWANKSKEFKVNHFVPMLKIDSQCNENEWVTDSGKRYSSEARKFNFESKRKCLDFNSFQSPPRKQTLKDFFKSKESHFEKPRSCSSNPANNQTSSGISKAETSSLGATRSSKNHFNDTNAQKNKHPHSPRENTVAFSSSTPDTPITSCKNIYEVPLQNQASH